MTSTGSSGRRSRATATSAGYESICVPGAVAGFALAAERFGRLPWRELVAPAIALAEAGMPVDWYASLSIAVDAGGLEQFRESRAIFLPDGRAPVTRERGAEQRLHNPALARTLQPSRRSRARAISTRARSRARSSPISRGGCAIDADDLAGYQARLVAPATLDYRGTPLHAMPGLSGGPTYLAALAALAGTLDAARAPRSGGVRRLRARDQRRLRDAARDLRPRRRHQRARLHLACQRDRCRRQHGRAHQQPAVALRRQGHAAVRPAS